MSLASAGKHCFIAANGGGGFLFLQRLDTVQVTFLRNAAGVSGLMSCNSGSTQPHLITKSRNSGPSPMNANVI